MYTDNWCIRLMTDFSLLPAVALYYVTLIHPMRDIGTNLDSNHDLTDRDSNKRMKVGPAEPGSIHSNVKVDLMSWYQFRVKRLDIFLRVTQIEKDLP